MRKHKVIGEPLYNGLPVNASPNKPCHGEILDGVKKTMDHMLDAHSKVFFARLDFKFPADYVIPPGNQIFVDCQENLTQYLRRQGLDPHRVWVREETAKERPHFHTCQFLNGHKIQNVHGLRVEAEKLWAKALKIPSAAGLVDDCRKDRHGNPQPNGIMIHRGDKAAFESCYRWASYLAKTRSKVPDHGKRFGVSQFPPSKPKDL